MNTLVIIGNLVRDPDTRTTQTGKQVCSFTVAVNRKNDKDKADYFRVNAWGNLADSCSKYLVKGRKVGVVGNVSVSTYTTQSGETRAQMDVFAESVEFLSPYEKSAEKAPEKTDAQSGFVQVDGEQLPF